MDFFNPISPDTDFCEVRECDYKGEHYSVRDNGAIMRHPNGDRKRPSDNKWTFGNKDAKSGYMIAMGVRVHIVVATAFHGEHDSKIMVVDHIDTNRCNNRQENLRWCTRLENALNNPATFKRILFLCDGNIQKFLDNPSCLRDISGTNQDLMWMRTVSATEAQNAYKNVMAWAAQPSTSHGGKMGEWIFQSVEDRKRDSLRIAMQPTAEELKEREERTKREQEAREKARYSPSINNPLVWKYDWVTPTEFLSAPTSASSNPILEYFDNLKIGNIFCRNQYSETIIKDIALHDSTILLVTFAEGNFKQWAFNCIEWEDNRFVVSGTPTFHEETARFFFITNQGKEWEGDEPGELLAM